MSDTADDGDARGELPQTCVSKGRKEGVPYTIHTCELIHPHTPAYTRVNNGGLRRASEHCR